MSGVQFERPVIESLHVENYRALKNITFKDLTPFTVLIGPNGSGKSTVFDAFAFLSESFASGLRKAWDRRGRFKELRSRGSSGDIVFEVKYRERRKSPLITYHLQINENSKGPIVVREYLRWKRVPYGQPFHFLNFSNGQGSVVTGEQPDESAERIEEKLDAPDMLAVNTLGQLSKHPRVAALRRFITGWYLSYLTADNTRSLQESGPQEHLGTTGSNLPNVIQYLEEQHKDRLDDILDKLKRRIPKLEKVEVNIMPDGRLLLQIKDAPFEQPVMARYASDGTLKMMSYLTLLNDPEPPSLIGIEEPESQLHPRLLHGLAEECRTASALSQLMVTTHSPYFVDALRPDEAWIMYRGNDGYTKTRKCSDIKGIPEFMNHGAKLGQLWMEGHFDVGDPLTQNSNS